MKPLPPFIRLDERIQTTRIQSFAKVMSDITSVKPHLRPRL